MDDNFYKEVANKLTYNEVVKALMNNDRNGSWDEIIEETDGNIDAAVTLLTSALIRIIEEEKLEGEELEFYQQQLDKIKNIP